MPTQAAKDWLALLKERAQKRGVYVDTDIDGRIFHFHLGENPGVLGKIRYSAAKSRNYENDQGQKHIWHRYDREVEKIEAGSNRKVVNVTLDVWDKEEFDPEEHHFIFLTEELINDETYSKGDQKIWIEGEGHYSGPLAKYVDDWDAIFEYATESDARAPNTHRNAEQPQAKEANRDTSGILSESRRTQVGISEKFKQEVYEKFDHHCPLTNIENSELLTVAHVLSRAENRDLAEDLENVVLLDWTHHMAFDAGLWTFDESGRLWVKPGFETDSESLSLSLTERHGEKIEEFASVADEHIEHRNQDLEWWPPR